MIYRQQRKGKRIMCDRWQQKQTMEATISPGEQPRDLMMEATIIKCSWFSIATMSTISPRGDGGDHAAKQKVSHSVRIPGGIMRKGPTNDDMSVLNIESHDFLACLLERLRFSIAILF
jgi:hypothetical protein